MNRSGRIRAPWKAAESSAASEIHGVSVARSGLSMWPVLSAIVVAAIVVSATVPPYPPFQDLLEWVYQGKLLALLLSGTDLDFARVADYPVPNSTTQVILALLSLVMPSRAVATVFMASFIIAASLVSWTLVRRYQPLVAGPLSLVLIVSVFLSAPFWNGYSNYEFGLLLFGAYLMVPERKRAEFGVVLVFGLAAFFTHLTIFAAFSVVVGLQALAARRIVPVMLGIAPAIGLALWYYLIMDRGRLDAGQPALERDAGLAAYDLAKFIFYKAYTLAKTGPYHNFVFASGGDAVARPAVYWSGVLLNCLYAALLVVLLSRGAWIAVRSRSFEIVPVAAAVVLGLVFLLLPSNRWIANTGERFMYPALLLLLLSLPLHRRLVQAMGALAALVLVSLLSFASERNDWFASLPQANWEAPHRVLFQHRPTAFVDKWLELERAAAEGDVPRQPLSFETSLLVSSNPASTRSKQ